MEDIFTKLNTIYKQKSYLDKYGVDVWTAIIITLVFFVLTMYYYVLNNIEPIKADWENKKCSPAVIPFAGLINKGPNESALDFAGKNFTGCIQDVFTNIAADAFQPVYYVVNNLSTSFSESVDSLNSARGMFDRVRNSVSGFSEEVMGKTLNVTMPLVQLLINIKSVGSKVTGILTGGLFTLFGSYLTMNSFFLFIIEMITVILYILVGLIVMFLIISAIPIFGSWAIPIAATNIAIMILILIPVTFIKIFMSNVLDLSTRGVPNVPRCFSGGTIIKVHSVVGDNIIERKIKDINIGDILKNGEKVTAIMKFSARDQEIYNLDGVYVTGEHRIFSKKFGWIKVKYHLDSLLVKNFTEPFVYCLGTDTKTFHIGEHLYSDWDDIDEEVIQCLRKKCPDLKNHINVHKYIHKYLDNGFIAGSLIDMNTGLKIPIENIKINDILANGEEVLGLIKIDGTDINGITEYKLPNDQTLSGYNVNICLGTNKIIVNKNKNDNNREKYLYQLLTDVGTFKVNGIKVRDYNYGIDKYL